MARNRSRSMLSLLACFVACASGCSSKTRLENSAEQTKPTIESTGDENFAFTIPQNAISPRSGVSDVTHVETGSDQERRLRIVVRGFASTTGNCRIAVYSNSTSFNQPEKAVLRAILPIEGEIAVWEPSEEDWMKLLGDVAIAAFQDVNQNEKLDKNSLGIPTERYGFSNNPKRGFGPPSFQQAKFTLLAGINALDIEIR